jgi:predicted RecA/RadA family phage recombinase
MSAKAIFSHGDPVMRDYTPPTTAVVAGDVVVINGQLRIAHRDIAVGQLGALADQSGNGVYDVVTSSVFADEDVVYWNVSGQVATHASTGNIKLGHAEGANATGSTRVRVLFQK